MMLYTYTPNQCPYQVSTSYTLWFLRYSLDKLSPTARPTVHSDIMGKKDTLTALKGCGVKTLWPKLWNDLPDVCSVQLLPVSEKSQNLISSKDFPILADKLSGITTVSTWHSKE